MAELATPVIEVVKLVGSTVCKYFKYQTKPNFYVRECERVEERLQRRNNDIQTLLDTQLRFGKVAREEVLAWLEEAKNATAETGEDRFNTGGCFCNICKSKHFDVKTLELESILDKGREYVGAGVDLVKDDPSLNEHLMREFAETKASLLDRKEDIQSALYEQLHFGKMEKDEVTHWLKKVEKLIESAEDEISKGGGLLPARLAKLLEAKVRVLKELHDGGEKFTVVGVTLVKDDTAKIKEHLLGKFEETKGSLQHRKKDIESTLHGQQQHGKVVRDEVKCWLGKVEKLLQTVEEEFSNGEGLSPARLIALLQDKIGDLKELLDEGEKYTDVGAILVKDDPSSTRGVRLVAEKCFGRDDALVEIPKHLKGDQVARIAVWGMGGIGKTTLMKHIHNQFLEASKFDKIIWVTVSRELNTLRMQDDIAKQITKEPLEEEDPTRRAGTISTMLSLGNYLLILDDVWGNFSAEKVGISAINSRDKCFKLVLTTRTAAVARQADCDLTIKLEPLSPDESLKLFLDKVGGTVLSNDGKIKPDLESTLKQIVEECDGLPLAIVTVARRMKREPDHQYSWLKALKQLRNGKIDVAGEKDPIMVTLKFSYDGLEDKKLQDCFLYCALYPEDFEIPKKQLISYWIQEGFFDQMETRHEMICEGHEILRKLQDNCMLECIGIDDAEEVVRLLQGTDDYYDKVKMHDLLRDMALDITSKSPRFFVKTGMSKEELVREKPWTTDVEKVSLMRIHDSMSEIPMATTHLRYGMLTTLLMPKNNVVTMPESLFMQTPVLKILDLSRNESLRNLPGSLSHLENLTTLILKHCRSLTKVPSLSKCLALTKLDLHDTRIEEVPDGVAMLINLMYLSLKDTKIESLPEGMLPKLSNLQYLSVGTTGIRAEEIVKLKKLENLKAKLGGNLDEMSILLGIMENQAKWLRTNTLQVKAPSLILRLHGNQNGMFGILLNGKPIFSLEYTNVDGDEDNELGCVSSMLVNHDLSLRCLFIENMEKIECVFGSSFNPLQTLEALYLDGLDNLTSVFDEKALSLLAPPSSSNSCFPLKVIFITKCHELKNLVSPALLLCYLQNLEYILIIDCEKMEEIISFTSERGALQKLTLPKLRKLKLLDLPVLKSICNRRSSVLICDSLEVLQINGCKELKRVSLHLPQLDDAQPSPSPLKEIIIFQDEWESWEWPQPNAKGVLLPNCIFYSWLNEKERIRLQDPSQVEQMAEHEGGDLD